MDKPEKKPVGHTEDTVVDVFERQHKVGYNAGRADMEKYMNWRMGRLLGVDEIVNILKNQCGKFHAGDKKALLNESIAKAIAKRIKGD